MHVVYTRSKGRVPEQERRMFLVDLVVDRQLEVLLTQAERERKN